MKADMVIDKFNKNSNRIILSMGNTRELRSQDIIDEELVMIDKENAFKRDVA